VARSECRFSICATLQLLCIRRYYLKAERVGMHFRGGLTVPKGKILMRNLIRPNIGEQTGYPLILLLALTLAPTSSYAGFFGNSDQAIIDAGGTVSRVAPNWRIVCLGEGIDAFGSVSRHKHCRIEKSDFKAIAVITSEGLSIPYLPSQPACGGYSGRMKVDGKPIGKLPLREKIAVMSQGVTFSRPYQTQWSKCTRITEFTGLYRFSAALARLKAQWKNFR
jgi:hypothetical protein